MAIGLTVHPPDGGEPEELTFEQQRVRIGRGSMCDLRIPHRAISSVHAMIFLEGDRYFLVDPGSTNGTTLNGETLVIERRKLLRSGDVIGVAGFEVVFRAGVAMVAHDFRDRTAAVAKQLARHMMVADGAEIRNAALVVMAGPQVGQRFEFSSSPGAVSVGRAEDNDVVLDDREASRHHVTLTVTAEGVVVRDLGGKNPLLVNDQKVEEHRLKDRDELLVGSTRLVFDEPVEAYLRELAQVPDAPLEGKLGERAESARGDEAVNDEGSPASSETVIEEEAEGEASDVEGDEETGSRGSREAMEAEENLPEGDERSPLADSLEKVTSVRNRGLSASTEVAVLFVGVLALAICIFALVWIFR